MPRGSILIVDDEEAVRVTLGAVLAEVGHTITLAAGQAAALVQLHAQEFDILLTDLRLDDGDGLHIVHEARRRWPDTVSLILTGYASVDSAVAALRQGAYDYLCKPCPPEDVLATVARGLERRQLTLQVRQQVHDLQTAISVARDLHASLSGLLREREQALATVSAELRHFQAELDGLVQRVHAALPAASSDVVEAIPPRLMGPSEYRLR